MSGIAKLSRRHLIRGGAAATLLAASSLSARAEPQRGGLLRIAAPGGWSDAEGPRGLLGRLAAPGSVFDCLTEIGADGRIAGELAEAWEPRQGARAWAISLRPGIRFHDGRPFGPEDAVASLRWHVQRGAETGGIASVRKTGPMQILVTLCRPDPGFPFALADPSLVMLPAEATARALAEGLGTGLYRLSEPAGGDRLRLVRVPDHYKTDRAGWFDAVELIGVTDPGDRTEALLAGRADAIAAPDFRRFAGAGRSLNPLRVSLRSGSHLRISARGRDAPALAAALKAGIDRGRLLAAFLDGEGRIAADHPLDALSPPAPDLDYARRILGRAGTDRATVRLDGSLAGHPGLRGLVQALHDFAAGAGLTLAAARGAADLTLSLAPAQPTDDLALARFPLDGVDDPGAFTASLTDARIAADSEVRTAIHRDLARKLAAEAWTHVPVFANATFAHSARLTHLGHIGALEMFDSGRIAERWCYGSYGLS